MNKQETDNIMTTGINNIVLSLYGTPPSLAQYLSYNLFRIYRPLRHKYKLTINEIVILNGIYIYNKLCSSSFTRNNIRLYVGYFNNRKIDYYMNSLQIKGCIELSDVIKGINRYKITVKGIEIINDLNECYEKALYKFIQDNSITI
jgi:hypothetical protein